MIRRQLSRLLDHAQRATGPVNAFGAGRRYRDRGDYKTAIEAFEQALSQWGAELGPHDPRSVNALAQIAYCRIRLGDYLTAKGDLEEVLRRRSSNPDATGMPKESDIRNQLDWVAQQMTRS